MSNYTPLFYVDVNTYPCPYPNAGLANLCLWERPQEVTLPGSKIHGAYMGLTWGRQDPGGPHVGPMILAIWAVTAWHYWITLFDHEICFDYKNIARQTVHTIVSWSNPNQWLMFHIYNLMKTIRWSANGVTIIKKWLNSKHTALYSAWKLIDKMDLILTLLTENSWLVFYMCNAFRSVYMMIIMR